MRDGNQEALLRLSKSDFRRRFRLDDKDIAYINDKGMERIRIHAQSFIQTRLAEKDPENDGKQTPMRGHPVFKAQHACACCCRSCLEKWHGIPMHRELSETEQQEIVDLIMYWIEKQSEGQIVIQKELF